MNLLVAAVLAVPADLPPQGQPPPTVPPTAPPAAQRPALMPVPLMVACHRGGHRIEIDGSLVDWPELPAIDLSDRRQLSGTADNAWRGPSDLSAVAFLMWDEQDCYFACTVKDEWHRALAADTLQLTEIPVADSVVLSFDPLRNTRMLGRNHERDDDAEFWLGDEASHKLLQWDRLRGSSELIADGRMVVAHDKELGLTTYEARIPWQRILPAGTKVQAGLAFDLQIVVNDFDESTDPLPQTRIGWTFGCDSVIDPGLFGTVMLVADAQVGGTMPDFPPKPGGPAPLDGQHWQGLAQALRSHPPALHDGRAAPEECGGIARLKALEELDRECADFPRIDYLELQSRIHRRMVREVAGISMRGLPGFWYQGNRTLAAEAGNDPPAGTVRLFRVPQGGWALRAARLDGSCLIDAAGADLQKHLWGLANFAVLTQPLDLTRRNDQLLLCMALAKEKRPFLAHIAFHLPLIDMKEMALVEPGKTWTEANGVTVQALGHVRSDGSVPYALGYRLDFPRGPSFLIPGPALTPDEVPKEHCTVTILTPRNPQAVAIARAANTDLVVVDDLFLCSSLPNVGRIALAHAWTLQKALLPIPSVILGPGESWDVANRQ